MRRLRVVFADDHPEMRAAIRQILEAAPDFQLVGEAGNGAMAVDLALSDRAELVVLDLRMPEMDGIQALRAIKARAPQTVVVILTFSDHERDRRSAQAAGADGYLIKPRVAGGLVAALLAAVAGQKPGLAPADGNAAG